MKIWLINPYALPPGSGGSERHVALARGLMERGHSVTIVAGSFNHFSGQPHELALRRNADGSSSHTWEDGLQFVFVPVPGYRGNGLGRLMSMVSFFLALPGVAKRVASAERPQVVVGSSLHLFGARASWRLARRWGSAFVLEIRDVWPETLIDLFGWRPWHPFVLMNRCLADFLYRSSDFIITTLPLAEPHFRERGARGAVTWIPNGCRISDLPEEEGSRPAKPFVLSYAGALSPANAVGDLLAACELLQSEVSPGELQVQIIGDGLLADTLKQRAAAKGLDFVRFAGRLPREETLACLRRSDASVLTIQKSPIYRWGFSMNKLADYLAAGRPVIIADVCAYQPVAEAGCGLQYPAGGAVELAGAIRELLEATPEERAAMGLRARRYAEEHFDWRKLAGQYEAVMIRAFEGRYGAGSKRCAEGISR